MNGGMIVTSSCASLKTFRRCSTWPVAIIRHRCHSQSATDQPTVKTDSPRQFGNQERRRTESQTKGKSEWTRRSPAHGSSRKGGTRTKNIIVGNLESTLEAHKVANKASLIGYYYVKSPESIDNAPGSFGSSYRVRVNQREDSRIKTEDATEDAKETTSEAGPDVAVTSPKILFRRPDPQERKSESNPLRLRGKWAQKSHLLTDPKDLRPWVDAAQSNSRSHSTSTHQEFETAANRFLTWMQPTPCERIATDDLIDRVTKIIKDVVPNCTFHLDGLRSIGVAQPLDRVEIVLLEPSAETEPSELPGMQENQPSQNSLRDGVIDRLRYEFAKCLDFAVLDAAPDHALRIRDLTTNLQVDLRIEENRTWRRSLAFQDLLFSTNNAQGVYMLLQQALELRTPVPRSREGQYGDNYGLLGMVIFALKINDTMQQGKEIPEIALQDGARPGPSLLSDLLHVLSFWIEQPIHKKVYVIDPTESYDKFLTQPQISALKKASGDTNLAVWKTLRVVCSKNRSLMRKSAWRWSESSESPSAELERKAGSLQRRFTRLSMIHPSIHDVDLGRHFYAIGDVLMTFEALHKALSTLLRQLYDQDVEDGMQPAQECLDLFTLANWHSYVIRRSKVERRGMALKMHDGEGTYDGTSPQSSRATDDIRRLARLDLI